MILCSKRLYLCIQEDYQDTQKMIDGEHCHDATDFSIVMSSCSTEIADKVNKGVSHAALGQFDKHSGEHSLQQISSAVIV